MLAKQARNLRLVYAALKGDGFCDPEIESAIIEAYNTVEDIAFDLEGGREPDSHL